MNTVPAEADNREKPLVVAPVIDEGRSRSDGTVQLQERIVDEQETWWRLSASEAACYKYPDDTDVAKAERAAFIEGFVTVARNTHEALKSLYSDCEKDLIRKQLIVGNAEMSEAARARGYKRHPKILAANKVA